jgi:hypothetical protein
MFCDCAIAGRETSASRNAARIAILTLVHMVLAFI